MREIPQLQHYFLRLEFSSETDRRTREEIRIRLPRYTPMAPTLARIPLRAVEFLGVRMVLAIECHVRRRTRRQPLKMRVPWQYGVESKDVALHKANRPIWGILYCEATESFSDPLSCAPRQGCRLSAREPRCALRSSPCRHRSTSETARAVATAQVSTGPPVASQSRSRSILRHSQHL